MPSCAAGERVIAGVTFSDWQPRHVTTDPAPTDPAPIEPTMWSKYASPNLGLLASAGVFILIGLRVLWVSQFNLTTATGIIQAAGAGDVALASFITTLPTLVTFALAVIAAPVWGAALRRTPKGSRTPPWITAVLVTGLCLPIIPWWAILLAALTAADGWRTGRAGSLLRPPQGSSGAQPDWRRPLYFALLVSVLYVEFRFPMQRSWFPEESLTVTGHGTFSGYVVAENGSTFVLLTERDRVLLRVPDAAVTARSYCTAESKWLTSSLGTFFFQPGYPTCPAA